MGDHILKIRKTEWNGIY